MKTLCDRSLKLHQAIVMRLGMAMRKNACSDGQSYIAVEMKQLFSTMVVDPVLAEVSVTVRVTS
jgi:hypothetical protein